MKSDDDVPMLKDDFSFQCPHCGEAIFIRLHPEDGKKQALTYDCEVCCHPISIQVEFDVQGIISNFSAEAES